MPLPKRRDAPGGGVQRVDELPFLLHESLKIFPVNDSRLTPAVVSDGVLPDEPGYTECSALATERPLISSPRLSRG